LDVDGSAGRTSLNGREVPIGPCVETGKGHHYHFRRDHQTVRLSGRVGFLPGLDARSAGNYVLLPPSRHISGKLYRWADGLRPTDVDYPPVPGWIVAALTTPEVANTSERLDTAAVMAGVPEGQRDDTLFRLACKLRRADVPQHVATRLVLEAAANCTDKDGAPAPFRRDAAREKVQRAYATYPPGARKEPATSPIAVRANEDLPDLPPDLLRQVAAFHNTDAGNAEAFALLHGNCVRYDYRRGQWLVWHGHCWRRDATAEVDRLALECVRVRQIAAAHLSGDEERRKAGRWALDSESQRRRSDLLETARIMAPIADAGDSWDTDNWLLGCENGVLDLQTGGLRPGRPEDRITMSVGYDFDPEAHAPRWRRFLEEVQPDQGIRLLLQTGVGYSLTGDISEQVFFMHVGQGGNGKTTQMEAVRNALGDYAGVTSAATFEQPRGGQDRIANDVAALAGKRFVSVSEIRQGFRLHEGRVEALTGGDKIAARFLHREWFEFAPVLKLWFAVNSLPGVTDVSDAFWRRLVLVPWRQQFRGRRADKKLLEALRLEAPGILNWVIEGCLLWHAGGLALPPAVTAAGADFRLEVDRVGAFLAARCLPDGDHWLTTEELYDAYRDFERAEGREDEVYASRHFHRLLLNGSLPRREVKGAWRWGVRLQTSGESE
jgi:putative DNA primase/helicase